MSSELRVFKSLNCSLCASPYSKSRNDPKYPVQLYCGKAVCDECWKKEKPLKKEERKHQCDLEVECYYRIRFSQFLPVLLSDPSIIESPNGNGYLLLKPITNPLKCPKCDVKYSMEKDENKPIVLYCGHPICTRCYLTHQTVIYNSEWYRMDCSICHSRRVYPSVMETQDNWFRDFLLEFLRDLPALIDQIPHVLQSLELSGLYGRIESISKKLLIGRGAFGEVFQVIDHQPPIAIKYINCPDETQIYLFQRECDVLRKLKHTHVVTLLASGSIKGSTQFGILMEFCERGTLKTAILNPNLIYSMKTVIFWAEELFDALNYMYKKHNVIHRDIKPDNIFVAKNFLLKIGDFGCIKYTEQTCSGSYVRTPRYMSSPQFDGNEEMIQGEELFDPLNYMFTVHNVVHRNIKPVKYFPKKVPPSILFSIFVDKDFGLKIGDFGFVKYSGQTCSGSFVGTPRYMSPPQFDGNEEKIQDSHRNDVYSMGLVLWEMIERRIVLSEYNNEQGSFVRDHFISDLYHKKITKLPSPNCQPELQEMITICTNFDRSLRPVALDVQKELKRLSIILSSLDEHEVWERALEKEDQMEIIRPLGFDDTENWVPI